MNASHVTTAPEESDNDNILAKIRQKQYNVRPILLTTCPISDSAHPTTTLTITKVSKQVNEGVGATKEEISGIMTTLLKADKDAKPTKI